MKINNEKLYVLMGNSCLTFGELSVKSGVSRVSINKFLKGKTDARPATIGKIARALNVNVQEIIETGAATPEYKK
jgi:transcriptional regulator with XRE-family HTH domain